IKGTDTKGTDTKDLAIQELKERIDEWAKEASVGGRILAYERKGQGKENIVHLLERPGIRAWRNFTVPMSMREVEPDVPLIMNSMHLGDAPKWRVRPPPKKEEADADERKNTHDEGSGPPFQALQGQELAGRTFSVSLPGEAEARKVRFMAAGDPKPPKNTQVVVAHPDLRQPDGVPGFAHGKLWWSELQDAQTGEPRINLRVRRRGATTSLQLSKSEWEAFSGIGTVVED
uniref:hypothetical protein n=1 Tax=Thiolapillus sp. TaxID=2017437 RepID=UPI003AF815FF